MSSNTNNTKTNNSSSKDKSKSSKSTKTTSTYVPKGKPIRSGYSNSPLPQCALCTFRGEHATNCPLHVDNNRG
ncbi:hypothetical protein ABKN59_005008 [Abortiporus biennis]